jgi:hypothetical protein
MGPHLLGSEKSEHTTKKLARTWAINYETAGLPDSDWTYYIGNPFIYHFTYHWRNGWSSLKFYSFRSKMSA